MRLIDADALEKFLLDAEMEATKRKKYVLASALNVIQGNVRNFPTVDPERKKGKWIEAYEDERKQIGWYEGSACKYPVLWKPKYCPNCGADMRGEQE